MHPEHHAEIEEKKSLHSWEMKKLYYMVLNLQSLPLSV